MADGINRPEWNYASGWVVALESRMARGDLYDRLLESTTAEEVLSNLSGSLLGDAELNADDLKQSEQAIAGFYRALMQEIRDRSPGRGVADIQLRTRELRALRNWFKRHRMGLEVTEMASDLGDRDMEALWDGTAMDAPDIFRAVVEPVRDVLGGDNTGDDAARFDAVFDSAMLSALRQAAHRINNPFIAGYWDRLDTVRGVEFLWRARTLDLPESLKTALVQGRAQQDFLRELDAMATEDWADALASQLPGLTMEPDAHGDRGGSDRLRAFDAAADRWLMRYVTGARWIAFGPERVFGMLVGLESEAYNMRVAVVGRANGMSADLLRSHLKATYV